MSKIIQYYKNSGRSMMCLFTLAILILAGMISPLQLKTTIAIGCPNLRVVFARGSGGERWNTDDYLAFKTSIESKLTTTTLSYEFIDLDYPAVGVGIDHLETTIGAYFGSGDTYEFGESVDTGVKNLTTLINADSCSDTKYIIGGYSQGAMVISKSLRNIHADKIIYAATFGDPKLYLPEGAGVMPAACRGEKLSDYRMYVPDCQAYKGLLGAYIPYEPLDFVGKMGTWCNRRDIFCSSHLNISDHLAYVSENLYEDASKVIFDKICKTFGLENHISSPHDTAILIDSTGSMSSMIDSYKSEALRLASETLANDGRVALYDYRDYQEGYEAQQWCNFETCTLEEFQAGLNAIEVSGGGDDNESLLASSLHLMKELKWKRGATKSVIVLTDAGYHNPDFDLNKTTQLDVVALSKKIDPVNFYVITTGDCGAEYTELAEATGGKVVTHFNELSLLTDYIMERYDSLPRVEEESTNLTKLPTVVIEEPSYNNNNVTIEFVLDGGKRGLVVLNDYVLGIVEATDGRGTISLNELDTTTNNMLTIVPLGEDLRGYPIEVELNGFGGDNSITFLPKAPNTGKFK